MLGGQALPAGRARGPARPRPRRRASSRSRAIRCSSASTRSCSARSARCSPASIRRRRWRWPRSRCDVGDGATPHAPIYEAILSLLEARAELRPDRRRPARPLRPGHPPDHRRRRAGAHARTSHCPTSRRVLPPRRRVAAAEGSPEPAGGPHGTPDGDGRPASYGRRARPTAERRSSERRSRRETCICETPTQLGDLGLGQVALEAQPAGSAARAAGSASSVPCSVSPSSTSS